MDILDIAYHLSRVGLTHEDSNKLHELIKASNKEYLYHQSFNEVKEQLFETLKKSIKED